MAELPDPDEVSSRETFVDFVRALRTSLERALALPMTNPYDDWRGGWLNRDLAGFVGGMAGWIAEAGRLPLSRDEHKIWDVVFPAHGIWDGGEANCRRT